MKKFSTLQIEIIEHPTKCNLCGSSVEYVDSSCVYGRSFGMIYKCTQCDGRVSVHKGTDRAMGILANNELRELKKQCHIVFDSQWKSGKIKRRKAYSNLAKALDIDIELCHIGYFGEYECNKLLSLYKLCTK